MHTYERSLVQRYKGQPFAIVGINVDADVKQLRMTQQKEQMNWRSCYDGPGGPLCAEWGVQGFPTVFLLDQRGVVRYRYLGPPALETLEKNIATLLQEID
jgi:hypothetical protein